MDNNGDEDAVPQVGDFGSDLVGEERLRRSKRIAGLITAGTVQ